MQRKDAKPGMKMVLSPTNFTGPRVAMSVVNRATLSVREEIVLLVSGLLNAERLRGTRAGTRSLSKRLSTAAVSTVTVLYLLLATVLLPPGCLASISRLRGRSVCPHHYRKARLSLPMGCLSPLLMRATRLLVSTVVRRPQYLRVHNDAVRVDRFRQIDRRQAPPWTFCARTSGPSELGQGHRLRTHRSRNVSSPVLSGLAMTG